MFGTWQAIAHIILLQVIVAFYYLLAPHINKSLFAMCRAVQRWRLNADEPDSEPDASDRHYGWRDPQSEKTRGYDKAKWAGYQKQQAEQGLKSTSPRSKHLAVLGLREPVHLIEVKSAYRRLAKQYHPDRYAAAHYSATVKETAAQKMRDVNDAYEWLRNNA